MPRVLLVSYHFPPSNAVAAQRAARLARLLPDYGYEVDVVCASVERAAGAPDPSQLRLIPDNALIRRVDTPWVLGRDPLRPPRAASPTETFWWKSRAYAEWLFLTKDWSWKWGKKASKVMASGFAHAGYDLFIVDAPPNSSIVPLVQLAAKEGIPIVIDLRDLWGPDGGTSPKWQSVFPSARRRRWLSGLREQTIRAADHTVLTSPDMAESMRRSFPDLDPSCFSFITNAYGEFDADAEPKDDSHLSPCLRIVYTGSLAYGREDQARLLIRGMGELNRQGGPALELLVAGDLGSSLVPTAEAEQVSGQVRFLEWIARDRAVELQREAGALLLLQPWENLGTRCAIPAKLFEYMARRRNILAMVGDGPAASIIREHGLGVVITGETPSSTADSLRDLVVRVKKNPFLPSPPGVFSERHTVAEFAAVLDRVLAHRRTPRSGIPFLASESAEGKGRPHGDQSG